MARVERGESHLSHMGNGASSVPINAGRARVPSQQGHTAGRGAPVISRSRMGFRTVLRNKHFLRLWMAQLISQTIMNASNYGIIILIATQSKSVTATGGAIAAFSLPAALFGAPAGVYVDRLDKRRVLWMSNALRALASFGFVVTLFVDTGRVLPIIYALIFTIALIGQFFAPAEGAAIPLLVHEDELVNALALFNITFTLSQAAGLIVLGPLVVAALPPFALGAFFGHELMVSSVQSLFLIVGVLYVICALLVATIPRQRLLNRVTNEHSRAHTHEGERLRGIWSGIAECWSFIRRDHTLFAAVLQLSLAGTVVSVIAEIAPSFVTEFFNLPEKYAALVFIPAGAGLVLGSVMLPHVIKRMRRSARLIGSGIVVLAACTFALTLIHAIATRVRPDTWSRSPVYFIGVLLLTFVMGAGLDLINIPAQTIMQERSPDWIKGRVLALQMMLFNAVTVPFVFLIGLIADYFQLPPAMNALAVLVLAAGFVTIWYGHSAARRPLVVSGPVERAHQANRQSASSGPIAPPPRPRPPRSPGQHEPRRPQPIEPRD